MNTTSTPFSDPEFQQAFAGGVAAILILGVVLVSVLMTHFTARAVAVVPVEQRRIQPGMIWGLTVVSCIVNALTIGLPIILMNWESKDAAAFAWVLVVLQVVLIAVNMLWIWWVGIGVPGSFSNAFLGYRGDAGVPEGDHARSLGRWMIAIYTIMGVVSLVTLTLVGPTDLAEEMGAARSDTQAAAGDSTMGTDVQPDDGGQTINDASAAASADATGAPSQNSAGPAGTMAEEKPRVRAAVDGQTVATDSDSSKVAASASDSETATSADATDAVSANSTAPAGMTAEERRQLEQLVKQGPVLILACVESLLSLVYLVLLITFLVKITNLRRSLLDLQFAASQPHAEGHDAGTPPLA